MNRNELDATAAGGESEKVELKRSTGHCTADPGLATERLPVRGIPRVAATGSRSTRLLSFACCLLLFNPSSAAAQARSGSPPERWTYDPGDPPPARWLLGNRRIVIGAEGGAAQFWMIAGVLRLRDGSVVVADHGSREIRVFDSKEAHRLTFGGPGRGPGEFPSLWSIWRAGGTLVGVDASGAAQSFTVDGRHLGSSRPSVSPTGQRITRAGYFADGTGLGFHLEPLTDAPSGESTRYMVVYREDEGRLRRVGRFPARLVQRRGESAPTSVVYGPRGHVVALDSMFCVGYSETYAFGCFSSRGEPLFELRRPGAAGRAVTEEDRQVFFHGIDVANPGPRGQQYRTEVRQTTRFARRLPPYGRTLASSSNELWVGPAVPADETLGVMNPSPPEPTLWSVYSASGNWLADVTLPARFRLMDAGSDYVAGVERDENEIERVVIFDLHRR